MSFKIFVPNTTAKSGEVNTNFALLKDKPFTIPYYETTTAPLTVNSWNLLTSSVTILAMGYIQAGDICDVISINTGTPVEVTGTMVVGQITNTSLQTVVFKTITDLATATITEIDGVKIIFPIHSTFEKLPEDVFTREFVDSFEVMPLWSIENHSTECNGILQVFNLTYIPVQNSVFVNKNGMTFLSDSGSNDYTINYSAKTITFAEAPAAGSNLFFQYQYFSTII